MRSLLISLSCIFLALFTGCASFSKEEQYGALGGTAGYVLCSRSQALVGLCVLGGAVFGSELGEKEDNERASRGTTSCQTTMVKKWTKDGQFVLVDETETCNSQVNRQGYRKYK